MKSRYFHISTLIIFALSLALNSTAQTFSNDNDLTITDDGSDYCSDIVVSGIGTIDGTFGLEKVCFKINHTWLDDMDIHLEAPDGTRVELSTDNGGSGSHYGNGGSGNGGTLTCLVMTASTNITAGTAPFQGDYVPEGDLADVNNGQNANGTWKLCVTDDDAGTEGFINSWDIIFSNTPASPGGGGGSGGTLPSVQQCNEAPYICSDEILNGNSNGDGTSEELTTSNRGCLSQEHESSWYAFEVETGGTIGFGIRPDNGSDDYDFAIWGPYPSGSTVASICVPTTAPIRCSYAAGAPDPVMGTGMHASAAEESEGFSGTDGLVKLLTANTGDVYIMMIDNWSATTSPFTLGWDLTGGASLNCSPLSVKLAQLTANPKIDHNLVEWETSAEIEHNYFILEKSLDGKIFEQITKVESKGSLSGSNYQYEDHQVSDLSYYRLISYDNYGQSSYSSIVKVNNKVKNTLEVYPNPSSDVVSIKFYAEQKGVMQLEMYNSFGVLVVQEDVDVVEGKNSVERNLKAFETGIYLVKIAGGGSGSYVTRVVKN